MTDLTEEQKALVERCAELVFGETREWFFEDFLGDWYLHVPAPGGWNPYADSSQAWDLMIEHGMTLRPWFALEDDNDLWWGCFFKDNKQDNEPGDPDPVTALLKAVIAKLEAEAER